MLGRGKSHAFIHAYTGMPIKIIEAVERTMNPDGSRRGRDSERIRDNEMIRMERTAPDYWAMHREEQELKITNRAFVALSRRAGAFA